MSDSDTNAGLDAKPSSTWGGAGSVPGPEYGEILTPLVAPIQSRSATDYFFRRPFTLHML